MLLRKCVPFWILSAVGIFASGSWSAPVPKEKTEAKTSEQEDPAEAVETTIFTAGKIRSLTQNNLKQIGLAVHNYASTYQDKIPQNVLDKNGKAILSWRVLLLPYLEQNELYKQFKMDEPWDSENNLKL